MINRSEKNVSVYNYSDGTLEKTFSSSYSFIDVTDLDMDDENEFLLLSSSVSGSPASAEAYKLDSDGMYHKFSCELSGSFTEFDSLVYGDISGGRKGLYIDAVSGTGYIQTDIIYMDSGGLNKVFDSSEESSSTVRPSGCNSFDVDGDGIPEIPVQTVSPGYDDVPESEQIKITEWMYVTDENNLERRYSSYYSITDGYVFLFPDGWRDNVMIKRDSVNDEMVFCTYENGAAGRELLRIFCAEDTASLEDRIASGYMLLRTKGSNSYLAVIPAYPDNTSDGLSLKYTDVAVYFRFTES
jgi:hypothetical protein